jgi:3'-5' exoribonuclease 1
MTPAFLVVDLEATCSDTGEVPRHEMETIEIGAVLVEPDGLRPIAEMQTFVRPVRHPVLTAFCTKLTTITQAEVASAPLFPEAIAALGAFLAGRPAIFCSWGDYDWKQLEQDAAFHRIGLPHFEGRRNLKADLAERMSGKKMGMAGALARLGLPLDGTHHRGIDDARNIAKLLPFCIGREAIPARQPDA